MPRSSAARKDWYKPNIFERLKQSNEDKKRRGHLKVVPPPRPSPIQPVQITGGIFRDTLTFNNIITTNTIASTTTINDSWDQWNGMLMNQQTLYSIQSTANAWSTWQQQTTGNSVAWRVWTDSGTSGCTAHIECWDTWQTPVVRYKNEWGRWVDTPSGSNQPRRFVPEAQGLGRYRVEESEEQKKARADEEARWRAEALERQKKLDEENKRLLEAKARAMSLLKACLTKEQVACLEKNKFFYVTAKSGRKYRIDQGTHGNVKVVDRDNKVIERLCIQPDGVPEGDSMLAQKLMIEVAEDQFRRHANITLNDGKILYGAGGLLDNTKLAPVIPIFGKKELEKSFQPIAVIERAG